MIFFLLVLAVVLLVFGFSVAAAKFLVWIAIFVALIALALFIAGNVRSRHDRSRL